jgi:hypothetical protein
MEGNWHIRVDVPEDEDLKSKHDAIVIRKLFINNKILRRLFVLFVSIDTTAECQKSTLPRMIHSFPV